jgi:hypothetical protein
MNFSHISWVTDSLAPVKTRAADDRFECANARGRAPCHLAKYEFVDGKELGHAAFGIKAGTDIGQPAQHMRGAEPRAEPVNMAHAVEERQDRRVRADRRRELIHSFVERIGFHAEQDEIEGLLDVLRGDGDGRHVEIAVRARNVKSGPRQLGGATWAHHEGDVAAGAGQAGPEIAAQCTCSNHEDAHPATPD